MFNEFDHDMLSERFLDLNLSKYSYENSDDESDNDENSKKSQWINFQDPLQSPNEEYIFSVNSLKQDPEQTIIGAKAT